MDALTASLIALACLAAGGLAGWCAHAARAASVGARAQASLLTRVAVAESTAVSLREQLDLRNDEFRDLIDRARADQVVQHERERREAAVLTALSPVRETLLTMQQKVSDLERDRHAQFGSLAEQLRRAHESDESLRATTESLAGALRSNTTRGVWGETQLRRVVEAAGLIRYVDFDMQTAISSDAGAGRPDMIIRLPGDKALAVDAKVPLDGYLEASGIPLTATGEEGARRKDLLQKHVRAVRAHVDALAKKAYWAGLPSSPELVICFVPSESLLSA
ncbi:MAG TPA: DNA recombination protein RmuC, partial [Microbacterium sp.]|nr:DNA recombination protein RmuC [Microbacterium sp.]